MSIHIPTRTAAAAPQPILLPEREAAKALSLSTRTLYDLRRSGALAHVRCGARVLYRRADLEAFAAANLIGGAGAAGGAR
jgi:excisionase family DNA binding protein